LAVELQMAFDVARGMNYLHSMEPPLVHRDLKSRNVLIDERWRAKISDFGTTLTKTHTFIDCKNEVGTPAWMAPECLQGQSFDEKADVYSFGVVLWELLVQEVPWTGKTPLQIVGYVGFNNGRLPLPDKPPAGCPREFVLMVGECWKVPAERPSFRWILEEFRKWV